MVAKSLKTQIAALPFRNAAGPDAEVLLITSRDTGRWVIPKGWPMKGKKPYEAAAQEAWEEAGVIGRVVKKSLGHYDYDKAAPDRASSVRCRVTVFPLAVEAVDTAWPEFGQRHRHWFPLSEAANLVDEKELSDLLVAFDLRHRRAREKAERPKGSATKALRRAAAAILGKADTDATPAE
ncbi:MULTISPECIES: NUDIX hydrolase [unclassified Aureimonas]|uniref:NUDIX hydrolase n=1 Tax=unclassified Aureimonas TaxID=2615206 RepID=UPI0009EB087C|nr:MULTISPECIES: NUDIX hydrolase [unclassified Aureimonas]